MELCNPRPASLFQMFCESVKIAGRAAVAATVSLSWENQKPGSVYERHFRPILEEGFMSLFHFHVLQAVPEKENCKVNIKIRS